MCTDPRCCVCNASLDDVPSLLVLNERDGVERYICDDCYDNPVEVD